MLNLFIVRAVKTGVIKKATTVETLLRKVKRLNYCTMHCEAMRADLLSSFPRKIFC